MVIVERESYRERKRKEEDRRKEEVRKGVEERKRKVSEWHRGRKEERKV